MLDAPKTKEQAAALRYGVNAANTAGNSYNPKRCAYEIWPRDSWHSRQCDFKNGKGVNGPYCGVHAKMVEGE